MTEDLIERPSAAGVWINDCQTLIQQQRWRNVALSI
jgi:hypothetical protein